MCYETIFFPVWLDSLNECQLTTSTLSIKSLHEQGKSIVMILQKKFLVQWRNFHDSPTTIFCSANLTEGITVVVYSSWVSNENYCTNYTLWYSQNFGRVYISHLANKPQYDTRLTSYVKHWHQSKMFWQWNPPENLLGSPEYGFNQNRIILISLINTSSRQNTGSSGVKLALAKELSKLIAWI